MWIASISDLCYSSYSNFCSSNGYFKSPPFDFSSFEIKSSSKEILGIKKTSFFCKKPGRYHLPFKKIFPFGDFSYSPKKYFNLSTNLPLTFVTLSPPSKEFPSFSKNFLRMKMHFFRPTKFHILLSMILRLNHLFKRNLLLEKTHLIIHFIFIFPIWNQLMILLLRKTLRTISKLHLRQSR